MFDLCAPMRNCVLNQGRYLFLEGDLKFKDNIGKVRDSATHKRKHDSLEKKSGKDAEIYGFIDFLFKMFSTSFPAGWCSLFSPHWYTIGV